jgi:predicted phage tail component-like protein
MSYIDLYFEYDGKKCTEFGIVLVRLDGGMQETNFMPNQSILEDTTTRDIPYFYGTKKEPLTIPVTVAKINKYGDSAIWTYEDKLKISQWLFQQEYKPLIFSDNPNVVYYCMPIGDNKRFFNGLDQGYATLQFRCDAPYGFTYPMQVDTYDLSTNTTTTTLEIDNLSNVNKYYYPEIEFEMVGSTAISLKNLSDGGRIFSFTGLNTDETVYVSNQEGYRFVKSDTNLNRLGNFNKNWLRLAQGVNRIEVTGQCKIQLRSQFPISI